MTRGTKREDTTKRAGAEKEVLPVGKDSGNPVGDSVPATPAFQPTGSDTVGGRASGGENLGSAERKRRKPYHKRTSKDSPESAELNLAAIGVLIRPIFQFSSVIMEKRGTQPLSESEISQGCSAFAPLIQKYAPTFDKYGIWIPPTLWVTQIVMVRQRPKEEKPKVEAPKLAVVPAVQPIKEESADSLSESD